MNVILLGVVALVIFCIVIYKSAPVPPQSRYTPVAKRTVGPVPNSNKTSSASSATSNFAFSRTQSTSANQKQKIGLCGIKVPQGTYLLPLSVYRHLISKKPAYFVLTDSHARCLSSVGRITAKLVSYNASVDAAYDYWGDVDISFQSIRTIRSFEEMTRTSEFVTTNLGYKTPQKAFRELAKQGADFKEPVALFKLNEIKPATPRAPIGEYNFFPGVEIISKDEVSFLEKKGQVAVVDLRMKNKQPVPIKSLISLPIFPPLKSYEIIPQQKMSSFVEQFKNQIPSPSSSKKIVFMGANGGQKLPLNMAMFYKKAGYQDVAVLKSGQSAFARSDSLTPTSFAEVPREDIKEFLKNSSSAIIIDTRFETMSNAVEMKKAWHAPLLLDLEYDYSSVENRKTVDVSRINFEKIKKTVGAKRIVLVGDNEYDWGPIILGEHLRMRSFPRTTWLREGFEGLWVYKQLKLFDKKLAKKISKETSVKKKKVKVPGKPGVKPKTAVKVERKKRSKKTFRMDTRR